MVSTLAVLQIPNRAALRSPASVVAGVPFSSHAWRPMSWLDRAPAFHTLFPRGIHDRCAQRTCSKFETTFFRNCNSLQPVSRHDSGAIGSNQVNEHAWDVGTNEPIVNLNTCIVARTGYRYKSRSSYPSGSEGGCGEHGRSLGVVKHQRLRGQHTTVPLQLRHERGLHGGTDGQAR